MSEADADGDPTPNSIFGDSEPPQADPQVIPAANHAQAHPFWDSRGVKGRGKGPGGRGRGRGTAKARPQNPDTSATAATTATHNTATALVIDPDDADRPAFTGISLRELEFVRRRNADGAESSVASEDDEMVRRRERKRKQKTKGGEDDDDVPDEARMAAAAFGCASGGSMNGKRKKTTVEDEEDDEEYDDEEESYYDENESNAAGSSTFEQCGSFPIRGESCIGCIYDRVVVGKVDAFVREHCGSMTETSLYRAASMFWTNEIVAPRAAEGVKVPKWSWKDLANHYDLHSVDAVMQRTALVRVLGAMRSYQSQSLLKVNPDGTKHLDAKAAEMMLKLVDKQDKQLAALDSARMPPPPPRQR